MPDNIKRRRVRPVIKLIAGIALCVFSMVMMIYIAYPWFAEHVGVGGGINDGNPLNVIFNFTLPLILALLALYYANKLLFALATDLKPFAFLVPLIVLIVLYAFIETLALFIFGFGDGASFRLKFALSFSPFVMIVVALVLLKAYHESKKHFRNEVKSGE